LLVGTIFSLNARLALGPDIGAGCQASPAVCITQFTNAVLGEIWRSRRCLCTEGLRDHRAEKAIERKERPRFIGEIGKPELSTPRQRIFC